LLGASVIMVVLAVFGVRAFRHRGSTLQFALSTMFLVLIPVSIYFAALRWLYQHLPLEKIHVTGWLILSVVSVTFMLVSTAVLLWFAEALVWLALLVMRGFSRVREWMRG
jgi:hypothetical protein